MLHISGPLYRLIRVLTIMSLLYWTPASAQGQDASWGALTVTSVPAGLTVHVDGTPVGRTPVEGLRLPVGIHTVRIAHPDTTDWDARDRVEEVVVTAGDTSQTHVVFVGVVSVTSMPFDAEVYVDGVRIGTTPIRLPDLAPGIHTVSIRKQGYQEEMRSVIIRDMVRQHVAVTLTQTISDSPFATGQTAPSGGKRLERILAYTTLGLGVVFSGLALNANRKADRAYSRYLGTADPVKLERFYREADRHDTQTSRFTVTAQINFGAAFYFFLSHAFRSDPGPGHQR